MSLQVFAGGFRTFVTAFVLVFSIIWAATTATAHSGSRPVGPETGIGIPGLSHGQMGIIENFRSEILALAATRYPEDTELQRVVNYARIQWTYCLWGLAPRGLTDETSPFNECSHAYLAATKDALLRMLAKPAPHVDVDSLAARVEMAMIAEANALQLCAYSAEEFNTAVLVKPNWGDAVTHRPSLIGLILVATALGLAGTAFMHWTRPVAPNGKPS